MMAQLQEGKYYDVTPQQPPNGFTAIELFCGGGLMAVGLKTAGFNIIWANDYDRKAVQAYRHNLGDHVVLGNINDIDIDTIPDSDIISGGVPCQDFSIMTGNRKKGDKGRRGRLIWTYLDIVQKKQPMAFVFENVKGLMITYASIFQEFLRKSDEIGYFVSWRLINSWDYGVAQRRERIFVIGIRKDLGFKYQFPDPKPEDYRTQVLRDVIGDLPESYINHNPKPLSEKFMKRYKEGGYDAFLKKHPPVTPDEPAPTITAHLAKGAPDGLYLPNDNEDPRRLTVRECLRIQSAPDWYIYPDNFPQSAMYQITGNGVPCKVVWYLGTALAEQLKGKSGR